MTASVLARLDPDAPALFMGLISGTSADAIDVAIVEFADARPPRLRFGGDYRWDDTLRARLVALGQQAHVVTLDEIGELDVRIARAFADAAIAALDDAGLAPAAITAIGSHGQTLRHRPNGTAPYTLQLGDPSTLAERTGIVTVADFRRRDVAAGGHGAPLLPALHAALLADPAETRAVLNLGGIANLTLLPPDGPVRGLDTGPANGLMDAWCRRHTGAAYDDGGALAAQGLVDASLLQRLLADPWFAEPPPKSTGRDQFHLDWLDTRLAGTETVADVQATLLALTARTVADALRAAQPDAGRVIACGGGVRNPVLMAALADATGLPVDSSARFGVDPDQMEAMGFAWLARQTLLGRPGNLPSVTGAAGPRVLGGIYPA